MSSAGSEAMAGDEGDSQLSQKHKETLLRTKLFIPSIRAKRVARPNLINKINSGLDKALILVSAPAGFGKTTILAEWASQAGLPVAWVSLDAGENDPHRFLVYLTAALDNALAIQESAICANSRAMLRSVQPLPLQNILIAIINDLTDILEPFALVLDDYQFITSPTVNETLTFLLEHVPPHVHLVIASRTDPLIPLHRLRAGHDLLEIRAEDLRFTGNETDAFMNAVMELNLSREDVSILADRTEGWIVGLQMAALSMQGLADRSSFVQALSGSHRYILEYLLEEVLKRQPENLQGFLLQTSILNRLCGPLCDTVLAGEQNSQAILEHLDRSNLFLTPMDQVGCWYRYHHLFADLLRAQLRHSQPERFHVLHLRASQWYEEAGLPEEAIQHAFAANELERTAQLVERYAIDILSQGEMTTLLRMFESLPEDLVLSRPGLGVYYAWALTFAGQFDKATLQLQEVEKQIQPGETTPEAKKILGSIAIIQGLMADIREDMPTAIELARQADELLPEENLAERSIIPFVLGDGYFATGELDKAEQAFEKINKIGQVSGNPWTLAVALHKLALLKKLQGKLRSAEGLYQEAIQHAAERGGRQYGSLGATYVGLSDLLREKNDLEAARQTVSQAIQIMEHWNNPTDLVNGYVILARISLSQGQIETADNALNKAEEISRQGNIFSFARKALEACQVRLWLAKGDLTQANRWGDKWSAANNPANEKQLDEKGHVPGQELDYLNELEWISMARISIARNELEDALHLLTVLSEAAENAGRNGRLIEILNLKALALHGAGERELAIDALGKSLALAEPEGYMRIFLDEGKPMEELLQASCRRVEGSLRDYNDMLLEAFAAESSGQAGIPVSPDKAEPLVEPLTGREIEVLHLLAAGLSNLEIAERLYLSEGTVKTHTHNLYGKLGVQSRTQALARSRELNLI